MLRIGLLGGFSVALGGDIVPDDAWRLRKAKSLVKWLALSPERRLHSSEAAEALWAGRDADAARNNLHQAIYAARRALGANGAEGSRYLELSEDLIVLSPKDRVEIDVVEFEAAAAAAREERDAAAYREALDSYEGELLPEDRYEEWTISRRQTLHELRLALGIELAELEAPADRAAAIARLRGVLGEEPLHEPAHRALMRLYAGGGQRQEAIAQFQELKRALRREFEDEPDDNTRRLYQEILTRNLAAEPERRLPQQLTSFIGRQRELGEIAGLLGGSSLLTLTGAGGCGKTRLAWQLAEQHAGDFPDGVWPVELAPLAEPELIGPAVAQALDIRLASDRAPEVAIADHIGERNLLLVLDNCEHLVESVAHLVEALLRRCPRLTVLATSREPLRVPGELTWRVPSLSLPRLGGRDSPEQLAKVESVRLFTARAEQAASGFALDEENADAVVTLCHRLDGMPLALELAAARVGVMAPAQIVERLDGSLDLLTSGSRTAMTRQQTLRATLAWSFKLLDAAERTLLRRLSVFAGSFGLEAAEAICAEEPVDRGEAVALLGRLVDKSLVQVEEGLEENRYRLLETVRQYATEQLVEADEREDFVRRHRDWYLSLVEGDPTPDGDLPSRDRLRQLDLERDNLRAALASAQSDDPQLALRLAVELWRFWLMRGYLAEGFRWLTASLAAAPERTPHRARALLAACLVGLRRGVHEKLHEFGAESIAIFGELGDHAGLFDAVEVAAAYRTIVSSEEHLEELLTRHEGLLVDDLPAARPPVWAAHTRGMAAWFRREYPRARRQFRTALERVAELAGDDRPALWPLSYGLISAEAELGYPLLLQEDTVILARRVGAEQAAAHILVNLAAVDRAEGDHAQAAELLEESLARFRGLEDRQGEALALNALGNLARVRGDFEPGRAELERSLALRQEIGDLRGAGLTLGCLAVLLARSGDADGARASAEQSRRWLADNDDLIGLSAAELNLAAVALCAGDRGAARQRLEAAASVFHGIESMPQEGWTQAVLAASCAEDGDLGAARTWLDRASRQFQLLGSGAGAAYCRDLDL